MQFIDKFFEKASDSEESPNLRKENHGFGVNDFAILLALANSRQAPCPFYLKEEVLNDFFQNRAKYFFQGSMNPEVVKEYLHRTQEISKKVNQSDFYPKGEEICYLNDAKEGGKTFEVQIREDGEIGIGMVAADYVARKYFKFQSPNMDGSFFTNFLMYCKERGSSD